MTLRAFRETAIASLRDDGEEYLRKADKMDLALVLHVLATGTVRLGAASSFVGTWLATLMFATILCGVLVSLITWLLIVPVFRQIIWSFAGTIVATLIPKIITTIVPIVVDYCLVGSEPFEIKHPRLFFIVDLLTLVLGGLAAITTAVIELLKVVVFFVINLYRIDRPNLPHPFTTMDAGFNSYCAVLKAYRYKMKTLRPDERRSALLAESQSFMKL